MANYTIAPNSNGQPRINGLPFPIPYVGSTGYALYNYLQEISADKIIPYMKEVSTDEFISGNYTSFQSPVGYTMPSYTLPFFETSEILLNSDTITVFTPHKGYIIGSPVDRMTGNFPIRVFEEDYNSNSVVIPPLGFNQTFRIIIYKTASSLIDFTTSNILNNGLEDQKIAPLTRIEFECQRDDSDSILITRWITPSVQDLPVSERQGFTSVQQGNVTGQKPSVPVSIGESSVSSNLTLVSKNGNNQGAIIFSPDGLVGTTQVKDSAITAVKLADGAIEQKLGYQPAKKDGTNWSSTAVATSLGYTPAKTDGTNWSSTAVQTSLGYTPAKVGDCWISRNFSFISPVWTASNALKSSPDLVNFTIFPVTFSSNIFGFGLQKGNIKVGLGLYTFSVTPYYVTTGGYFIGGSSAFYLQNWEEYYMLSNAAVVLNLGSSNTVTHQTLTIPFNFSITVYFSKTLLS
jgi:hypothetical protein